MAPPIITGQRFNPMIVGKNKILTVHLTDLFVDNPEFPDGSGYDWSIEGQAGSHYTVDQGSGITDEFDVISATDYVGSLSVATRVDDGVDPVSGWFGLNVSVVEVPIITNQKSFPKVYVSSYITITLDTLIVQTTKMYPQQFIMIASAGTGYSIDSSTDSSVKIKIEGSPNVLTRSISIRVNDSTIWSDAYNYIVNVVPKPRMTRSAPMGASISAPSPFIQPFRRQA